MRKVVLLSGRTCNGKSELAKLLHQRYDFHILRTSEYLCEVAKKRELLTDRVSLQSLGDTLDEETSHGWVIDLVKKTDRELEINVPMVVDNIRTAKQLAYFRQQYSYKAIHVHLYARSETLAKRYLKRQERHEEDSDPTAYEEADLIKSQEDILSFKKDADVRIFTERTDTEDTFVRVAAHLGLYAAPDRQCVDVLVGGQYGSEGKGHVAAYLSREYDVLMRVGGPNAGHTVASESGTFVYSQLPSGCRDNQADILIGPGATIDVPKLLKEIENCKIESRRLYIDPQVMTIGDDDKAEEKHMQEDIGSTGSGSGAAAAKRIMGRLSGSNRACLARDVEDLKPYLHSTHERLQSAFFRGEFVLLEGTQGSGLSLYHGAYPYVTSRDTNVSGCLAEAGIPPRRIRKVLMVVRRTPIRVESPKDGNSGPLKHPTNFKTIAAEAKLEHDLTKAELTSTTKRPRRVGWFEWETFRHACALNSPTDIILTFADYHKAENQNARRFEQLHEDTIKFIEELERVAQAPVSMINTRFPHGEDKPMDLRTVIDRRSWRARTRRSH